MEAYRDYSLQKPIVFMYFLLNYCDGNHIERILVALKNIDHLFNLAGKIIKAVRMVSEIIEADVVK